MRKLHKISFLLFFLLLACQSYKLSNDSISEIEREDDNLCMAEGVQYKYADTRVIYWKCRLRVIDQHIANEPNDYGYDALYVGNLKSLRRTIAKKIEEQKEIIKSNIKNSQEEKEHNYCIMMKNNYDKNGTSTEYDYFECREKVASIRKKNKDLSNLNNKEFFEKFIEIQDTKQEDIKTVTISGECVRFIGDVDKLKECEDGLKNKSQCSADIQNKLNQRTIDDKVFCTKESIKKYPDSLAKFNSASSTDSIGPKIDKIDMVGLREKEYDSCYKERRSKWLKYKDYLEYECSDAFKIKNEENKPTSE